MANRKCLILLICLIVVNSVILSRISFAADITCVFRSIQAGIPFQFRPPFRCNSGRPSNGVNKRRVAATISQRF